MPDWNPDREGHVDHKYIVLDATRERKKGIQTSKGLLKFDKQGRMMVKDPTLAHEIRTSEVGKRDVTVSRVRFPSVHDRGHTYFFTSPGMPWHKYDENGNRIKDDTIHERETKTVLVEERT